MKWRLLYSVLALVSVALVSAGPSASAFTSLDPARVWRVMPVTYAVDSTEVGSAAGGPGLSIAKAALENAVAEWNATGSGWNAVVGANVSSNEIDNQKNEMYWLRTWDPSLGDKTMVLAVARIRSTGVGPQFTTDETDLPVNGDEYSWNSGIPQRRVGPSIGATHIDDVIAHEVGHSLGLGHSQSTTAIMYFQARNQSGVLGTDDTNGALSLYPPGGPLCSQDAQCPVTPGNASECSAQGTCVPVPPGQLGAPCNTSNSPCGAGLQCLQAFGEGQYLACTKTCTTQADCGQNTFCIATTGENFCMPPGSVPIGGACSFRSDCQSGHCSAGLCRQGCTGDDCECDIGDRCATVQSGSLTLNFCFPGNSACVRCGDGNLGGDEECDDGEGNSDMIPDACRSTCLSASCGDGLVDSSEACDDGNLAAGDGCDPSCVVEVAMPDAGPGGADGGPSDVDAGPIDGTDAGPGGPSGGGDAGPGGNTDDESGGGCSAPASSRGSVLLLLVAVAFALRRRD